jgi:hypothetical protein
MTGDLPLEHIRAAADRVAQSYGLEVFDVQFRRERTASASTTASGSAKT